MISINDLAPKLGLRVGDLEEIRRVIAAHPAVARAAIFGSRAKGTYHTGSDVDLALWGNELTDSIVQKVSFALNEETLLPFRFDVLDASRLANKDLISHIERVSVEIYTR
jgi:uncharacterized protein